MARNRDDQRPAQPEIPFPESPAERTARPESEQERGPRQPYDLRYSELQTLADIGTFRTLAINDLAQFRYAGDNAKANAEVRNLVQQGLLRVRKLHPSKATFAALTHPQPAPIPSERTRAAEESVRSYINENFKPDDWLARPAGRDIDPGSRTASGFLFLITVISAALDVGRLHQSDSVPSSWQLSAIMVFAGALILQAAAMIVNLFFSPALCIQAERGHSVIACGPYRFLRHPGYLAMLIAVPASALALGSWLALIPAFAFSAVIIRRTPLEDCFLEGHLSGYSRYMFMVRYRVFFGIW